MPFYRRLAALRSAPGEHMRIVAFVPQARETTEDARTYFTAQGLTADRIQPALFPAIGITGTPTLALVDSRGIVKDVWTGKLPPEEENEVVKRIGSQCPQCAAGGENAGGVK
jgi:hypothetical protein